MINIFLFSLTFQDSVFLLDLKAIVYNETMKKHRRSRACHSSLSMLPSSESVRATFYNNTPKPNTANRSFELYFREIKMICRWHSRVSILWVWVIGLWVFILTFGSFSAISWLPATSVESYKKLNGETSLLKVYVFGNINN